ncbi:putative quinol monooxygenase [Pseudoduganella violacea]|uniref:Quinol monooxygenase YgiN n=1 Tax=Pseudoduganella violacea TaxID=1715466 RepID=A0A7W5BF63_9BURK|nr:putative quinol monooxygenase [Pseudoduganella violacea]MBB3122009.1 quinol monooxygenase YgiN [Pseudoduganella violacea]
MYLLATLDAHPQFRTSLLAALDQLVAHARTEPGTLQYEVLTTIEDENRIMVFERYTDAAALQAHLDSAPLQAVIAQFEHSLSTPPSLVRMARRDGFLREGLANAPR